MVFAGEATPSGDGLMEKKKESWSVIDIMNSLKKLAEQFQKQAPKAVLEYFFFHVFKL